MTNPGNYLYSLVRYVPDVVRGEYVNIGALVRDPEAGDRVILRFTADWGRLRALFPDADVELLEAVAKEISAEFQRSPALDGTSLLQTINSWSNCLQVTEPKGMHAESMESGLEQLLHLYVGPPAAWHAAEAS